MRGRLTMALTLGALVLLMLLGAVRLLNLWSMGRIGFYSGEWIEVPANPSAGFHVPYRLYVPVSSKAPHRVWVRPNNSSILDDALEPHDQDAAQLLAVSRWQADWLGAAVLVPSFIRPESVEGLYTHALDADSLGAQPPYGRPDQQVLAMVDDARTRLDGPVCDAVFLDGFSASGMFVSRFVSMHPERVAAAVVGAPGGWPLVPSSETGFGYPLGIADFLEQFDARPNLDAWRKVPLLFHLGSEDTNDSAPFLDGWTSEQGTRLMELGETPVARWGEAERRYEGFNAAFVLDEGLGHEVTIDVQSRTLEHLREHDNRESCR